MNGRSPRPAEKHVEEVLRFARKLGMHSDPEQLLRALPSELCALLDCTTTAVIHLHAEELRFHVVDWRWFRTLRRSFGYEMAGGDLVSGV